MQNVHLIPLCMLTYKEDNYVLLLSVTPAAWVVEVYTACINVPTLLINYLGINLNSHDGISEVSICFGFFLNTCIDTYVREARH